LHAFGEQETGQGHARVGPTTPTRAGRLADDSVDPTEARKDAGRARALGSTEEEPAQMSGM
jgi:hypothetical protein